MLVLTRQVNEEIIIGDEIRITIVAVSGGQVKVGITAPKGVAVHRKEVHEEIRKQNVLAAEGAEMTIAALKRGEG